jgi:transcription elongation factor Elf1
MKVKLEPQVTNEFIIETCPACKNKTGFAVPINSKVEGGDVKCRCCGARLHWSKK